MAVAMFHECLREAPEKGLDIDIKGDPELLEEEEEEKLYCAHCGRLVTMGHWRIALEGGHEHTFFNPAGLIFEVLCFKEAPGAFAIGRATGEFTWFPGYKWQIALCSGCRIHLGWRFVGSDRPPFFFGLIGPRLTTQKPEGPTA